MPFPLGRPIAWMILIAAIGGAWMTFHRSPERADLTLWVFATPQFHDYKDGLVPIFKKRAQKSVDIDLVTTRDGHAAAGAVHVAGPREGVAGCGRTFRR